MVRALLISTLLILLVGCGPAVFREEIFYIENGLIHREDKSSVWLYISSTVKSKDIFPVYYSSSKSGPYSVYFRATSNLDGYDSIYLSNVVVRVAGESEKTVLNEKVVKRFSPLPDHNYSDISIQLPLGNMLTFAEGKKVEVCVKYGYNDSSVESENCSVFYGKKSNKTMSNFDVYMSV